MFKVLFSCLNKAMCINKNNGVVIWLTGLSGSGKTTIANSLYKLIIARHVNCEILDGDSIRSNLNQGLGYTKNDRDINVRRVGYIANLLSRNGVIVIVALISPYRATRDEVKLGTNQFIEVYVDSPLEICELRDIKGLYVLARDGKIKDFTGIDDPYEPPLNPDITCLTYRETIEESVFKIVRLLEERNFLAPK
jgi:adenylylsulfate kinase